MWTVLALVVGSATTALAANTRQGYAIVRFVIGSPMVSKGGGAWQKLERYMLVRAGDVIQTDAKSHADLMLGFNNGDIQVSPGSTLAIDKLLYTSTGLEVIHDTQLNLREGVLYGNVDKMATGSKYEVKTPRGVAGIRGTSYRIAANGDIIVIEGVVVQSLVRPDGTIKTYTIMAGYVLVAATGEIRQATEDELGTTQSVVNDCMTHGGGLRDLDPEAEKFKKDSSLLLNAPYVSPTTPGQ
jgi:hypothetical protein